MQEIGIVPEESEPVVAPLTQQSADRAGGMIVVKMLLSRITADRASVALGLPHVMESLRRELVTTIEVGGAVRFALAGLALATEASGAAGVSGVILMRYRLLAGGAPTEAFRDPGMIADQLAHRATTLPVVGVALRAVARLAVEGRAVAERPVSPECRRWLRLATGGTELRLHCRNDDYGE
jgi:hypothetical protein